MTKQQKRNLYSTICFYIALVSLCCGAILFILALTVIVDENHKGIHLFAALCFFVVFIISLVLLGFLDSRFTPLRMKLPPLPANYGYKGVPNNKYEDFFIPKSYLSDQIVFDEIAKNVFETKLKDKVFLFDMNGWNRPITYISQLITTELQVFYTNGNRKSLYKSIYVTNEIINLVFNKSNGKIIKKTIVRNNRTKLSLVHKLSLISKIGLMHGFQISFKELYDFNY